MAFLTESEKKDIAAAIRETESKTCGEIVTVIALASDSYAYIPLLWAAGLALVVPFPLLVLELPIDSSIVYLTQLVAFLALGLLFRLPPLKMRMVPRSVRHDRAARMARAQFLARGIHRTEARAGILLFVSVAERHVEVLADSGINDRVEPGAWDGLIASFVAEVQQGRTAAGFLGAIKTCSRLLEQHFPRTASDRNELPNHLIEI